MEALFIHGITAHPEIFTSLGQKFDSAGISYRAPLLAGHGTQIKDLKYITWNNWVDSALPEAEIICGHSLGALVSLWIALHYPVKKLILISPSIKLRKHEKTFQFLSRLPKFIRNKLGTSKKKYESHSRYTAHSIPALCELFLLRKAILKKMKNTAALTETEILLLCDPEDHHLVTDTMEGIFKSVSLKSFTYVPISGGGHHLLTSIKSKECENLILEFINA
jgi:carboxylesterase